MPYRAALGDWMLGCLRSLHCGNALMKWMSVCLWCKHDRASLIDWMPVCLWSKHDRASLIDWMSVCLWCTHDRTSLIDLMSVCLWSNHDRASLTDWVSVCLWSTHDRVSLIDWVSVCLWFKHYWMYRWTEHKCVYGLKIVQLHWSAGCHFVHGLQHCRAISVGCLSLYWTSKEYGAELMQQLTTVEFFQHWKASLMAHANAIFDMGVIIV